MNPRKVLRIARWEVLKGTDSVTRRDVLLVVGALALTAALGGAISSATVAPDAGIYVVGVDGSSPYHDVASEDPTFVVVAPDREALGERLDLLVTDDGITPAASRKGRAALSTFRTSVRRHNDRVMAGEPNRSAAFPLLVRIEYVQREAVEIQPGGGAGDGSGGDGQPDGDGTDDGSPTDGTPADESENVSVPKVGGQPLFSSTQEGRPGEITPPFPFGALLLAFAFVVPMNFVVQAYGASVLRERLQRRGELLLVSPVSPGDIVAGKTLPYLLGTVGIAAGIAATVGGGLLALAAVVPIALVFLGATFLAGMFARSFKELTFLTVTISVGLTSYLFVPAIFTEVTPIALISPLTVIVRDLLGEGVTAGQYLFSTGPFYAAAAVTFVLGLGVYREESMFTQRPVHLKALDALATRLSGYRSVAAMTAALIPFVVLAELLAVALLFALPLPVSLLGVFLAVAVVEELAKSVHVYAGFATDRFPDTDRTALAVGLASGVGFFLGEKLLLLVQVVGLPELTLGRAAFPAAGGTAGPALLLLLVAPLALHASTAAVSALGARRGPWAYGVAYTVAVVGHLVYNAGVVTLVA